MKRTFLSSPAAELVLMGALCLSGVWLRPLAFPGYFWVCAALYVAIGVWSHWKAKETPRDIGIRFDNIGPALLYGLMLMAPIMIVGTALGAWLDTAGLPESLAPSVVVPKLAVKWVWGTMQQYGLACVFYRRLRDLTGSHASAAIGAAGFFALCHLPNPFLTLVTFVGGMVSCQIYRRTPNLFVLGFLHLVLSTVLRNSLGPDITHGMRVGPGYWGH